MDHLERLSERAPGLVRRASWLSTVLGAIGAGSLFAATIFGSIVWTLLGIVAFLAAGVLWYLGDMDRE